MARIVLVGEAMLELSRREGAWQLGYGGDTLNTAIHLARAGHDVGYLTAIGADPLGADLKRRWQSEGFDTGLVLDHPARATGLHAVSTDAAGERSFTYWRGESAAREMFALAGAERALAGARNADLLGFSLISLAIFPEPARAALLALARSVRERGGKVAFDGNYREGLWPSAAEASHWLDLAIACSDFGLPTLDDERALGRGDAASAARHWQALGCAETVVKLGAEGCRLPGGEIAEPVQVLAPVDSSGAGDAFNAGYLGARMHGAAPAEAARAGHALAGWTIMRPGAIPAAGS